MTTRVNTLRKTLAPLSRLPAVAREQEKPNVVVMAMDNPCLGLPYGLAGCEIPSTTLDN